MTEAKKAYRRICQMCYEMLQGKRKAVRERENYFPQNQLNLFPVKDERKVADESNKQ